MDPKQPAPAPAADGGSRLYRRIVRMLDSFSVLERGAAELCAIDRKKEEINAARGLTPAEQANYAARRKGFDDEIAGQERLLRTLNSRNEADAARLAACKAQIRSLKEQRTALDARWGELEQKRRNAYASNRSRYQKDMDRLAELRALRGRKLVVDEQRGSPYGLSDEKLARNRQLAADLARRIEGSPRHTRIGSLHRLKRAFKPAMSHGEDLTEPAVLNRILSAAGL